MNDSYLGLSLRAVPRFLLMLKEPWHGSERKSYYYFSLFMNLILDNDIRGWMAFA